MDTNTQNSPGGGGFCVCFQALVAAFLAVPMTTAIATAAVRGAGLHVYLHRVAPYRTFVVSYRKSQYMTTLRE